MTNRVAVSVVILGALVGALSVSRTRAAVAVDSVTLAEARAFLDDYRASSSAHTVSFYDLYSDRALIHAHIEGRDASVAFQGRAYKQWGRDLIQSGRAAPDASDFQDPTVEQRGARLVIRAMRYSITRCYWDVHYQVALEREGPAFRIVDEHLTTKPGGRCAGNAIATAAPTRVTGAGGTGLRLPAVGYRPTWRPLSQEEIAESALRLAQETAAKYPAQVRADGPSVAVPLPARHSATRLLNPPSTLWVTPED